MDEYENDENYEEGEEILGDEVDLEYSGEAVYSRMLFHIILSIGEGSPFIDASVEEELYEVIGFAFKECKSIMMKIGGTRDHLHIIAQLTVTKSLNEIIEAVRRRSAQWMRDKDMKYKNFSLDGDNASFTTDDDEIKRLNPYIDTQKEFHKRITFQEELKGYLDLYNIEYEDKYKNN